MLHCVGSMHIKTLDQSQKSPSFAKDIQILKDVFPYFEVFILRKTELLKI